MGDMHHSVSTTRFRADTHDMELLLKTHHMLYLGCGVRVRPLGLLHVLCVPQCHPSFLRSVQQSLATYNTPSIMVLTVEIFTEALARRKLECVNPSGDSLFLRKDRMSYSSLGLYRSKVLGKWHWRNDLHLHK